MFLKYIMGGVVADEQSSSQVIFTTRDLWNESSWCDAAHFDFEGYDTSPFWDDDGTSYIIGSHAYKVEYDLDVVIVYADADPGRPGNHLAKMNLTSGELQSNWINLWAGTGGLVSAETLRNLIR
jgi:hypothetical protein